MASITIPKFFKQAEITSGHTTAQGLSAIIGTNWQGIGITWAGNNITGMTAFGKSIDFSQIGGGTLGTAAATETPTAHGPQITLTKPNGTVDAVNLATAQDSYLTITADNAGTVTFGTTIGTADSTGAIQTAGLVDTALMEDYVGSGVLYVAPSVMESQNRYALFNANKHDDSTLRFDSSFSLSHNSSVPGKITIGHANNVTAVSADQGVVTAYSTSPATAAQSTVIKGVQYDANGHITAVNTGTLTANTIPATKTVSGSTVTTSVQDVLDTISGASVVTFGSTAPANDEATMSVTQNGQSVGDVVFGVNNGVSPVAGTTYGLELVGTAFDAPNVIRYGLNANTMYALGLANTALQPVTAVPTTDMFTVATGTGGNITVTAKSYAQATTAQSTVAAGTESFTVGNGKLGLVIDNTTLNTFGANATSDVTYNIVTTATTVTGGGARPTTPSATDAYQPTNTAANFNPLATQSYVDAKMGDLANALVYKGTVDGTHPLPSSGQKTGDVYVVAENGTYAGEACEVGDLLIWNGTTWDAVSGENQVTNVGAELTAEISSTSTATQTTIATVDGTNITVGVKHYDVTPGENVTAPTTTTAPASQNYMCGITMDADGHVTATSYANPFDWETVTLS